MNLFKKVVVSLATVAIAGSGISTASAFSFGSSSGGTNPAPETPQSSKITLNQGDYIYSDISGCTVSYVGDDYVITSAQCGIIGQEAYTDPAKGKKPVGKFDFTHSSGNNDVMMIKLYDNVEGQNIYSGNNITTIYNIKPNDKICHFGQTTKKVTCVNEHDNYHVGTILYPIEHKGADSGGPVWVEGKGYLGVITDHKDYYINGGVFEKVPGTLITEASPTINRYHLK